MTELQVQWDEGKYLVQKRLGDFVQFFQIGFPTNTLGVPTKVVHPAPLMQNLLDYHDPDDVPDEVLDMAAVPVEYMDGIPTIDGLPVWERLEGETIPNYKLFKEYKEMVELYGTRSYARLAEHYNIPGKYISALAKVYNWSLRCKCYDAIKRIEAERRRHHQIEKLASRHSEVASKMLEQGMQYLEDHPEQMSPKLALQMVETAMKAGRLALGLNGDKPGSSSGASTNINIQQNAGPVEMVESTQQQQQQPKGAEVDHLQSILHILDQSGALNQAKAQVIDAQFTDVDEDEAAV